MLHGKTGALTRLLTTELWNPQRTNLTALSQRRIKVPEEKCVWAFLRSLEVILMFNSYKHRTFQRWKKSKVTNTSSPIVPEWHHHTPKHSLALPRPFTELLPAAAAASLLQSCPTLCDPRDGSPPGSPVPGSLQARTLEWAAISFSNAWKWKGKVKSLSHVWPLATPRTATHQVPPSMGFSRQEQWSGLPLPSLSCYLRHINLIFCLFYSVLFISLLVTSCLCNCFSLPKSPLASSLICFSLLFTERK